MCREQKTGSCTVFTLNKWVSKRSAVEPGGGEVGDNERAVLLGVCPLLEPSECRDQELRARLELESLTEAEELRGCKLGSRLGVKREGQGKEGSFLEPRQGPKEPVREGSGQELWEVRPRQPGPGRAHRLR